MRRLSESSSPHNVVVKSKKLADGHNATREVSRCLSLCSSFVRKTVLLQTPPIDGFDIKTPVAANLESG